MTAAAYEVNFDGLVGPTHNYAGLAKGNLASQRHQDEPSNPKAAALQGLAKMKVPAGLGLKQAVLPPHERPDLASLRRLGFEGRDADVLRRAQREAPRLFAACNSASSMWAANAATVSPSPDTADGRMHFTAANLIDHLHRSIEAEQTTNILQAVFADASAFAHHAPLAATVPLADEGAANHTRLCRDYHEPGIELFVYGGPSRVHPARQRREASEAIARLHGLAANRTAFVEQNPVAIDAGVFHNDVIAVGNQHVLLMHADAFTAGPRDTDRIRRAFETHCQSELTLIEIARDELALDEAVTTYLFNSQLVTPPTNDGTMTLICPTECQQHAAARSVLDRIVAADNPITAVHFVDTHQSMKNGGGPACLRLRVVLSRAELAKVHSGVIFTESRYAALTGWVEKHYRDHLTPGDLADPKLLEESRTALDELTGLLGLGSIYLFQQ